VYSLLDFNYKIQETEGNMSISFMRRGLSGHLEISMNDIAVIGIDRPDEEILTYEVSDEALETASGIGSKQAGNLTLACTYFYLCPI
jgi:hypothetical protein